MIDKGDHGTPLVSGGRDESIEGELRHLARQVAALTEQQREIVRALALIGARLGASAEPPPPPPPRVAPAPAPAQPTRDPVVEVEQVQKLMSEGRLGEAEALLRAAVEADPRVPLVHTSLGNVYRAMGKPREAEESYRAALALDWRAPARKLLAELRVADGRVEEAIAVWEDAFRTAPLDAAPLHQCTKLALLANRLDLAEACAQRHSRHALATRFWPEPRPDDPPLASPPRFLKAPKLRHDIEQFEYLRERGVVGRELEPVIEAYRAALARVAPQGDATRVPANEDERRAVGPYYGRICHVTPAPRVARALSYDWDMAAIESHYIDNPPGILCIDRLLSDEALASLRRFCLESTIWSTDRYDNGYLGSFLRDGFDTPLLWQIAEELRAAMPRVIGERRLVTMWGFKYDQQMTGITLHADVAAVNVNFWLTPNEANLDQESGGLIVYDAEAPQAWNFNLFNGGRSDAELQKYLDLAGARPLSFPHRQNRALIFNSDLFHCTAPFRFAPGYTNRRINVTMLFGDRRDQRLDASQAEAQAHAPT
jgi:tetratricopeptide (TPR) repeat protein